jgi:hypothetical protein
VNKTMVLRCGHLESGLKEAPVHNSNFVPVKGVVEYFDKNRLQKKRKGVECDFSESHNFQLNYHIGERVQSLES